MYSGTLECAPKKAEVGAEDLVISPDLYTIDQAGTGADELYSIQDISTETDFILLSSVVDVGHQALSQTVSVETANSNQISPQSLAAPTQSSNDSLQNAVEQPTPNHLTDAAFTIPAHVPLVSPAPAEAPLPWPDTYTDVDPFGFIVSLQMLLLWVFLGDADIYTPSEPYFDQMSY